MVLTTWQILVTKTFEENKHKPNYRLGDAMKDAKIINDKLKNNKNKSEKTKNKKNKSEKNKGKKGGSQNQEK
jgi:hypothetical protein